MRMRLKRVSAKSIHTIGNHRKAKVSGMNALSLGHEY